MEKLVYLFELDSVRNTDKEIELGQKMLFNEIVGNGNVVVLTYNQLVDSRGFFSLLAVDEYYESFVALFEKGAIRISQYGDIRTITQYLINSFDYDKEFIFSGWPLKSTQKRLLALIKRSLTYNDLEEIHDFYTGRRSEEELLDLFIELDKGREEPTRFSLEQCRDILKNVHYLLKMVLRISSLRGIYIQPKDKETYKHLTLPGLLNIVLNLAPGEAFQNSWAEAKSVIETLPCYNGGEHPSQDRSNYLHDIREQFSQGKNKETCQLAEAIVNLCYNYTCEISICNISRHYNSDELSGDGEKPSFGADFFGRLQQDWNMGPREDRYLREETNAFTEFVANKAIPDFKVALRIRSYTREESPAGQGVSRYEKDMDKQKSSQKARVLKEVSKRVIIIFACILIAAVLDMIFNNFEDPFDDMVRGFLGVKESDELFGNVLEFSRTLVFLCIVEALTSLLSKRFPWLLSFTDALVGMGNLITDSLAISFGRHETYQNAGAPDTYRDEARIAGQRIDCLQSAEIKKYVGLKTKSPARERYFAESGVYPFAIGDRVDAALLKRLNRLEEIYGYKFGLVYKSGYNHFVVDAILDANGDPFPYERVLPSKENGVVIVAKKGDKFILLKQYRHAIRGVQYAFPRGYGEADISQAENAKKELQEELGAEILSEPVDLGVIVPDSGLSAAGPRVFLVEIGRYEQNRREEGVLEILEIGEEELLALEIDDAFTIAAFLLYKKMLGRQA